MSTSTTSSASCLMCDCTPTEAQRDWMEWKGVDYCEDCYETIVNDHSGERLAMGVELADFKRGL